MKLIKNWFFLVIVILIIGNLIVFSIKNFKANKRLETTNRVIVDSVYKLNDTLAKINYERYYITRLLNLGFVEKNKVISDSIQVYNFGDENHKSPLRLAEIIKKGRPKLIVRYTEIGCNACTDSTFRLIRKDKALLDNYEPIVLVDFSNYEYFVKWKKISEVDFKVLWLKKGSLPFSVENENASYIFTVGNNLKSSGVFLPNSMYIDHLKNYLNNL